MRHVFEDSVLPIRVGQWVLYDAGWCSDREGAKTATVLVTELPCRVLFRGCFRCRALFKVAMSVRNDIFQSSFWAVFPMLLHCFWQLYCFEVVFLALWLYDDFLLRTPPFGRLGAWDPTKGLQLVTDAEKFPVWRSEQVGEVGEDLGGIWFGMLVLKTMMKTTRIPRKPSQISKWPDERNQIPR